MTNRLYKVENKGVFEINAETGNQRRDIENYNKRTKLTVTSKKKNKISTNKPIITQQ